MPKFFSQKEIEFIKGRGITVNNQEYDKLSKNIEAKLDQFFLDIHLFTDTGFYSVEIREKLFSIRKFIEINLK